MSVTGAPIAQASKNSSSTQASGNTQTETTFNSFEGNQALQSLMSGLNRDNSKTQGVNNQGLASLQSGLGAQPKFDTQYLQNNIKSITDASDAVLPSQIAQARSDYYGAPTGRNQINLTNTIAANTTARDAAVAGAMQDQYNADSQLQYNYDALNSQIGQYLSGYTNSQDQYQDTLALAIAQLLAGTRQDQATSSSTRGRGMGYGMSGQLSVG